MAVELRVKESVRFRRTHLRPHILRIIEVALETAPKTTDEAVWITSAWRPEGERFSLHPFCAALDFRCKNIAARSELERRGEGEAWAKRMRAKLGPEYDVLAHGEGEAFHIHAEFDPR